MRETFERAKSVTGSYGLRSGSSDRQSVTFHFRSWDIPLAPRHENGDGSGPNKIVLRGALPHHYCIGSADSGCLAVRSIFLLSVHEDGHRLVYAVGRGHGFDRSGSYLQARQFLPAGIEDGAQRRAGIGAQRNRASARTAQILCAPFVLRLSDRYRRNGDLGLWGCPAQTDFLGDRVTGVAMRRRDLVVLLVGVALIAGA